MSNDDVECIASAKPVLPSLAWKRKTLNVMICDQGENDVLVHSTPTKVFAGEHVDNLGPARIVRDVRRTVISPYWANCCLNLSPSNDRSCFVHDQQNQQHQSQNRLVVADPNLHQTNYPRASLSPPNHLPKPLAHPAHRESLATKPWHEPPTNDPTANPVLKWSNLVGSI